MLPHLGPHQTVHTINTQDHVTSLNFAITKLDFNSIGKVLHFLDSDSCLDE